MDVLDLLLTFQFNTRLESFIAKFKAAEVSASSKKSKQRSILAPLLYDNFDPFDTAKSVAHTQWPFYVRARGHRPPNFAQSPPNFFRII